MAGSLRKLRAIRVESGTIGKVIDPGVKDANQMGSAMAPAAVDTILNHLEDTGRDMGYYDAVITGDPGIHRKRYSRGSSSGCRRKKGSNRKSLR